MRRFAVVVVLALVSVAGCGGGDDDVADAAVVDAGTDTGGHIEYDDAAGTTVDASRDLTAILGTLSGPCGVVGPEVTSASPSMFQHGLTFMTGEMYVKSELSPGGQRLFDSQNAGGSSTESETMSFEILHFCDDATLVKTETEILYQPPDDAGANTITDMIVLIGGRKVGVNPVRAFKPTAAGMSDVEVREILVRKLDGIIRSSERVQAVDRWVKQILHVFVATEVERQRVAQQLATIPASTRANTIVLITRTIGGGFLYCNPDPALGSECPLF